MFVLDTNILSTMMSTRVVPEVAAWIAGQAVDLLFTTSISQAEILSGLAIMPESRRRSDLEVAAKIMFLEDFEGRVLSFDMDAAIAYADIFAARRRAGRPTATVDLMIASLSRAPTTQVWSRVTSAGSKVAALGSSIRGKRVSWQLPVSAVSCQLSANLSLQEAKRGRFAYSLATDNSSLRAG